MSSKKGVYETNEYGKWLVVDGIRMLVEPSQKWHDENPPIDLEPPTPSDLEELTNYVLDVDYRLVLVEMGLS